MGGAGNTAGSGQNKAQAPATNYAVAGPAVNAQCGTTANATGTVASNTALVRTVMNPVTMTAGTAGAPPYKLVGAALGTAGTAAAGTTNSEYAVTAATRGQNTNSGADYTKIAPIGCIDASVAFLETKTSACTTWGGGLLGPLPALPPGPPCPTVIRCLRTVATNQLPPPQLAGTLPRP